tara:strand:- start:3386 stop:3811 length:426 start_codon:yes stop_codon:yes gene_type:complete
MSRFEGYSTWDSSNNTIGIGPVQGPPEDSTDTWYPTYIDFEGNFNGILKAITAAFDADNKVITRSLANRVYDSDNSLLLEWVRTERNDLLIESDWTQVADSPLTDSKKAEWATYRQSLRDLPANNANVTNIDDVTFPTAPT